MGNTFGLGLHHFLQFVLEMVTLQGYLGYPSSGEKARTLLPSGRQGYLAHKKTPNPLGPS